MLHGRAGPYSSAVHGRFDATTLRMRHEQWGEFWAGSTLAYRVFEGAEHNYDDPGEKKQSNSANASATAESQRMADAFFAKALGAH
ncbi:MAG: hypothetical protein M3Y30_11520 [Gemmatimonadota bacterium]|nr:hypothetical protein [Gemmatimonadota bacterium]